MDVFKKIGQEESTHSSGSSTRVTIAERERFLAGEKMRGKGGILGGREKEKRDGVMSSGRAKLLAGFGGLVVLVLLFSGGRGYTQRLQRNEVVSFECDLSDFSDAMKKW